MSDPDSADAGPTAADDAWAASRADTEPTTADSDRQGHHGFVVPAHRMLAGRYRLDRVIGSGAMGIVWAAYDEVLHRAVAIKEVNYPQGMPIAEVEQLADRTLREARAIAAMSNPHVITLYDILTLESGPVIVMELLTARSLAQVLRQDGPLRDGQAATIGVAVAGGLLAAHGAGITHRDVKPGNVLIGHDGRIKLTDFGIARSADEQTITAKGLLLGSPAYIAPEVAAGHAAGNHADAWGLGALLFAAVQGRPPYDRGDPIATLTAVVSDPVPPHPQAGRLGGVIDALLVKDPRGRLPLLRAYQALQAVAEDPTGMRLGGVLPGRSGRNRVDRIRLGPDGLRHVPAHRSRAAGPDRCAGRVRRSGRSSAALGRRRCCCPAGAARSRPTNGASSAHGRRCTHRAGRGGHRVSRGQSDRRLDRRESERRHPVRVDHGELGVESS